MEEVDILVEQEAVAEKIAELYNLNLKKYKENIKKLIKN